MNAPARAGRRPLVAVWLPSLAGLVPVPGPLLAAALVLRHRMVKGAQLDRALRFIGRRRTAVGCSLLLTREGEGDVDAVLPADWRWARGGWDLMHKDV